ncbi:MAG: hypothetical protein AB8I08_29540 [Sandaracinaceae bacterium]
MLTTLGFTLFATALIAAAGFSMGLRRARAARRGVEERRRSAETHLATQQAEHAREKSELAESHARLSAEVAQLGVAREEDQRRLAQESTERQRAEEEREQARARAEALAVQARGNQAYAEGSRDLSQELRELVAPLTQQQDGTRAMESAVRGVLGPLVERERVASSLLRLKPGQDLGDLPDLLARIARAGGFASVLLSDESGLPIAVSSARCSLESTSGVFALLVTMADRMERIGAPVPRSLVIADDENQSTVHRIFRVGAERYLLSASSRRAALTPDTLDATLPSLEATLTRRAA